MNNVIELSGVTKTYQGREVLHGVDLSVTAGSTYFLVGPNGCGKTTTVESLVGLRTPTRGKITVLGKAPGDPSLRPRIRVCLQGGAIHPQVTVREHFDYLAALYGQGTDSVETIAEQFVIQDLLKRRYGRLSGGQQKRVLVAGCLFGDADLIVLDEPTSGVDLESRLSLWESLSRAMQGTSTTLLATTHDLSEAEDYADNVIIMRDGRIVADGSVTNLIHSAGLVGVVSMPASVLGLLPDEGASARSILSRDRGTALVGYTDVDVLRREIQALDAAHGAEVRERSPRLSDVYLHTYRCPNGLEEKQ
ncbi:MULTISPECIES: ABC transporter ATP-binding protein [Micrococcaceae]|uniref:ABC transporter ATP-binding protein n=1 Tax=unclassified Kocuria TaxID=2649579 RepID=UPI0013EAF60E|nr:MULTISPECIES: ABC transporter ATP-binding protein [unclassified Kocuria]